ncbi:50S ribosomal protein L4 [Candidatus Saccharibacteria bacterium]|nr:50S ribosomal protein L4 [Candidatus Saccharibacteria bacterium]
MAETLNKDIFGLKVENHELVKLAYDTYLANSRSSHAKTLKRGEVRGGGKKPWKQKGTGRARFGSTRNPIWRHGGVAFGRTGEENFTKKISKNAKLQAVRQALSMQNADKNVVIVKDFAPKDGKVKETIKFLADNKLETSAKILFVVAEKSEMVLRATNNINTMKVVRPTYLNVFDILNADKIVISESAMPAIEAWLIGKENA